MASQNGIDLKDLGIGVASLIGGGLAGFTKLAEPIVTAALIGFAGIVLRIAWDVYIRVFDNQLRKENAKLKQLLGSKE